MMHLNLLALGCLPMALGLNDAKVHALYLSEQSSAGKAENKRMDSGYEFNQKHASLSFYLSFF